MTRALVKIRSEHSEMSLVLHCLERVAEAINRGSWPTDFKLLYHLIDWFEAFPATFHHPKEELYLFPVLRRRCPEAQPIIAELQGEHARGLGLTAILRSALDGYVTRPERRSEFCAAARAFTEHERRHIDKEEGLLLPLAQRRMTTDDWVAIDEAFDANPHPLLSPARQKLFDDLFTKIMHDLPRDVVFGSRTALSCGQ